MSCFLRCLRYIDTKVVDASQEDVGGNFPCYEAFEDFIGFCFHEHPAVKRKEGFILGNCCPASEILAALGHDDALERITPSSGGHP